MRTGRAVTMRFKIRKRIFTFSETFRFLIKTHFFTKVAGQPYSYTSALDWATFLGTMKRKMKILKLLRKNN